MLPELKIGNLVAKYPIIQGGMGVGISLSSLAGAVAKAGGIGVISAAQPGWRDPEFARDPLSANLRALAFHIRRAKEISNGGIIGVNIMRSDSAVFESNAKFHRLRVCGPPANAPAQKMLHGAATGLRSGYW